MTFITERNWPAGIRFFRPHEFACDLSGMVRLHPGFIELADDLRAATGLAFNVVSGCRNTQHNRNVGGAPDSLHICDLPDRGCMAMDIRVTPTSAWEIIQVATRLDWSIGVPKARFLHLDARKKLLRRPAVAFGY
jgi:uncharacterized protein YcbK (DUF882 family)